MLSLLYLYKSKCYAYVFILRFDQGWHNQTRFDLHGKGFFSNESNSETAINNVQKTDSTSCKFVDFGSETVTVMMQVSNYNASAR